MGSWDLVRPPPSDNSSELVPHDSSPQVASQADASQVDASQVDASQVDASQVDASQPAVLQLPTEIIDKIFSYLQCPSLVSLSRTCKKLKAHAENDLLWARLVRAQLPPDDFPNSPHPSESWRSLYISHHPYWHLARNRVWFSDEGHAGKIILVKFDARRGCIEGYRLVADRGEPHVVAWTRNPAVAIHVFDPRILLWLEDPAIKLDRDPSTVGKRLGWWDGEIEMKAPGGHNIYSTFFLSRAIPDQLVARSMDLWPPLTIPGMPRVRRASHDNFQGWGHKPQKLEEISETTFRMRKWVQFFVGGSGFGVRMSGEVSTWSTLDPKLYTPTSNKPFQGIFVGDYSGHGNGCEFLLVIQTEKSPDPPEPISSDDGFVPTPPESVLREDLEAVNNPSFRIGSEGAEDDGFRGAIEAIKLSGDSSVPRGEHTFIADDIGPAGFIRIAKEPPFQGARVVRSRGHIAAPGFLHDHFIKSQLYIISPNKLAQYWLHFSHISFYERVDISRLLAETFD